MRRNGQAWVVASWAGLRPVRGFEFEWLPRECSAWKLIWALFTSIFFLQNLALLFVFDKYYLIIN